MVADFIFSPNLPLCAASFAATALLTRYAWPVCERLGLIDLPDARKQHARATPLLGGPALIGIILPLALLATWLSPVSSNISLLHLAVTTAAVALVGILDDRRPLSARVRVGLAFVLFGGLALYNKAFLVRRLVFPIFGVQFGLYSEGVALLFTVVCCVGLVNAINMADGKNGLVLGLCIGWLMLIMARSTVGDIPFMAVMLAGLISLLVINLRGRLFLGDGGAYGLAAAISLLTIRSYSSHLEDPSTGLSAEIVVLLFLVPVLDSFRLTFVRLARGQSPMAGDRDHLHHHLQNRFGWPNGLYLYLLLALAPATLAEALLL
jgi:UDP-GlcNAc:undecaprenyl-phosphate GlcNAc-1-phosphate transferase